MRKTERSNLVIGLLLAALLVLPQEAYSAAFMEQVLSRFGCVAGEALSEANVLMMKSDGKCYKAKADDSTLRPAIGVAEAAAANAANVGVVTRGIVGGESSLTKGGVMYLNTTAAGTTQTQPTAYSQIVGQAISATEWVVNVTRARQKKSVSVHVPDPGGAAASIAAGYVLWSPPVDVTVTAIKHIPEASWVAAAATNDASLTVTNASVGTLATLAVVTALATGTKNDMGAITNAVVVGGTNVTLTLTASGTANAPASMLLIEYIESGE